MLLTKLEVFKNFIYKQKKKKKKKKKLIKSRGFNIKNKILSYDFVIFQSF